MGTWSADIFPILATFTHYQLSPIDMIKLRATALNYHADFQNKFLWNGLLPWCKDFIVDNGLRCERSYRTGASGVQTDRLGICNHIYKV